MYGGPNRAALSRGLDWTLIEKMNRAAVRQIRRGLKAFFWTTSIAHFVQASLAG